ncbi:hypothetical protein CR51_05715 [Caballeronia megalochromosomata]|nr:hypothetical protein CR51_05715 [Caballeronia megalochromosomata]
MLKGAPDGLFEMLDKMEADSANYFESASWLESDFLAPEWNLNFDGVRRKIDWRVHFGEGLLTDPQYSNVLRIFKSSLIAQTDSSTERQRNPSDATAKHAVAAACRIVDYFLLHQDALGLSQHGLRLISVDDITNLMYRFERGPTDAEAIYDWTGALSRWLEQKLQLHRAHAEILVEKHAAFRELSVPIEEWTLPVDADVLPYWRAALWLEGGYKRAREHVDYRLVPHTKLLASEMYQGTIAGKGSKPVFEELSLYPVEKYLREYPGVSVRTGTGAGPEEHYLGTRRRAVLNWTLLEAAGLEVPADSFEEARNYKPVEPQRIAKAGRFRNPPFWQVMDGMRDGYHYCRDHGKDLLDSYKNILLAAREHDVSPYVLLLNHDIEKFLTTGTRTMGVTQWCLRVRANASHLGKRFLHGRDTERWDKARFFSDFRAGRGLLQNIRVFYGGMSHLIGPHTARRQAELMRLPVHGCLDKSRTFIHFQNGKSGTEGLLEKEVRPIPPAVELPIAIVQQFHEQMAAEGLIRQPRLLFDIPGFTGINRCSTTSFNRSLDEFCDFFQTPLTDDQRRYYLREHQFRRFFIIAFFFSARNGDLGTLRWFVAHTDAEHLYNYLTNNISGDLYREVSAYFLTDELRLPEEERVIEMHEGVEEFLRKLVQKNFGTGKFSVIDADALEAFLELQVGKSVQVEPEFFPYAADRFPYKIVVKLKRAG